MFSVKYFFLLISLINFEIIIIAKLYNEDIHVVTSIAH